MIGQSSIRRTGPVGRLARVVLLALFVYPLTTILGPGWSSRFRSPHILSEPSAWLIHLLMLLLFVILVGALAASVFGPASRTRWMVGATLAALAVVALAGGMGLVLRGSFWGFPLADVVWWFDVVMLTEQVAAFVLVIALGIPGCEIGIWPHLISRIRGRDTTTETGLACVVGLHLLDRWEANRATAVSPEA